MRRIGFRPAVASGLALAATVAAAGALLSVYAARIEHWSVMTDELLYVKLATAIGTTLSPLPVVHGEHVAVLNQLYPLLLAPLFGALDVPAAFRAAHLLNAFVMASAAVPTYLLARAVVPRVWSHVVAALAVAGPWTLLTGVLMTEAAAYPAFLWAILALERAVAAPSDRRDVLALAGLGLGFLARTQFLVLAAVLPLAVLVHEARSVGLRKAPRSAFVRHRVLAIAYGAGALTVLAAAAAGVLGRALGSYSVTAEGSLLPEGIWRSALVHLDLVGVGLGLVPLLLGLAWLLESVVRPSSMEAHAFAFVALLATGALALQVASYDLRFGGGLVRDRYLFYVAPLLLVAAAAALRERPRIGTLLAVSAVVAWSIREHEFEVFQGVSLDSPASVVNDALRSQAGGLAPGSFAALLVLLVGVVLALALRLVPRLPLAAALAAGVLAFSVTVTSAGAVRVLDSDPPTSRHLGPGGAVPDWIDSVLPAGAAAAAMPFPISAAWDISALLWWDVEFWNRSVEEVLVGPGGRFSYGVPPSRVLRLDFASGRVPGTSDAPEYVVLVAGDPRFRPAGPRHAANFGLEVIAVERPLRMEWATRGLDVDGWTRPGRPATIRVYGDPGSLAELHVQLAAPPGAVRYTLEGDELRRADDLGPGNTRVEELRICIPSSGRADVRVLTEGGASIPGPPLGPEIGPLREVGAALGQIALERPAGSC